MEYSGICLPAVSIWLTDWLTEQQQGGDSQSCSLENSSSMNALHTHLPVNHIFHLQHTGPLSGNTRTDVFSLTVPERSGSVSSETLTTPTQWKNGNWSSEVFFVFLTRHHERTSTSWHTHSFVTFNQHAWMEPIESADVIDGRYWCVLDDRWRVLVPLIWISRWSCGSSTASWCPSRC